MSSRSVTWWQNVWDLHSRSRVRVRACTFCKSLGQSEFYLLTWTYKVRFSRVRFPQIQKKYKITIGYKLCTTLDSPHLIKSNPTLPSMDIWDPLSIRSHHKTLNLYGNLISKAVEQGRTDHLQRVWFDQMHEIEGPCN